jgi:hypothetical protein
MLGFQLFLHSLRMIFGNFGAAVRVTIPVLVFSAVIYIWMFAQFGTTFVGATWDASDPQRAFSQIPDGFALFVVIFAVGATITFLWTATAWHRFILLEETPGSTGPRWNGGAIWRYFKAGFILVLLMFAATLALSIITTIVAIILAKLSIPPMLIGLLFSFLMFVPLVLIFYRLSPILPSAAVGTGLKMSEAWDATRGAGWSLIVLAVVSVLAAMAISIPGEILLSAAPVLGVIWQIGVQWISSLFGISILTTIYGVYVEKRDLNV